MNTPGSRATPVPVTTALRIPPLPIHSPLRSAGSPGSPARPSVLSSPESGTSTLPMPVALGLGKTTGQPHLVSLVLQSKKALQHGEHLCTRAHAASSASAQAAVDVLALDAKVRWVVEAVVEQLKLAATVAKTIEEKRALITKQVDEWDASRAKHTEALDAVLDSLGSQLVPPEFHQTSSDSSLFGSQHGSDDEQGANAVAKDVFSDPSTPSKSPPSPISHILNEVPIVNGHTSPVSPSATLRRHDPFGKLNGTKTKGKQDAQRNKEDRKYWKTLRDFVDVQSIEDALDMIESDKLALDNMIKKTEDYPETLTRTINSIQASLPSAEQEVPGMLKRVQDIVIAQESLVRFMASVLENLVIHYDKMASALKESERGEAFTDQELVDMNRDTEELAAIMSEMEKDMKAIEDYHEQLRTTKENLVKDLEHLTNVLEKLEELGEILDEMIQTQDAVEAQVENELNGLQEHLNTLRDLHEQFVSYRMAFNKLLLEIARRRQYKEAAENIVQGMMRHLDSMTEEESRVRAHFNAEYGVHLPEDICLCIRNEPTKWEVVPSAGNSFEVLPFIAGDLIIGAREQVGYSPKPAGAESL